MDIWAWGSGQAGTNASAGTGTGQWIDRWMDAMRLCNHIIICTDTCDYMDIIPSGVITMYTWGEILQNLKPLRACVRMRVRVCAGAWEIVNKL